MFGKKVSDEEMHKDAVMDFDSANFLHYYILFDRLACVPLYSPFVSKNDSVALRNVANLLNDSSFRFKPSEVSLYHIFKMNESTLTVEADKYFVCYLDEVNERLDKIQGEL